MLEFYKINKNPKKKKTGDCTTRALCNILNITYEKALKEQYESCLKTGYAVYSREVVNYIMKKHGWIKMKQPKIDGKKIKIKNIDDYITSDEMEYGVLISTTHHYTVVRDYVLEDIWDCGDYCCGNYFVKNKVTSENSNHN